jgi:GTPase SAR1 family protein
MTTNNRLFETLSTLDETTFKVLLVGDTYTGKTCIAQRFVYDRFTSQYRNTIGVDFLLKRLESILQDSIISRHDRDRITVAMIDKKSASEERF